MADCRVRRGLGRPPSAPSAPPARPAAPATPSAPAPAPAQCAAAELQAADGPAAAPEAAAAPSGARASGATPSGPRTSLEALERDILQVLVLAVVAEPEESFLRKKSGLAWHSARRATRIGFAVPTSTGIGRRRTWSWTSSSPGWSCG